MPPHFLGFENQRADWRICDYVMDSGFVPDNRRHRRFPIWAAWNLQKLIEEYEGYRAFLESKRLCYKFIPEDETWEMYCF